VGELVALVERRDLVAELGFGELSRNVPPVAVRA
jgi:hypothetical protein